MAGRPDTDASGSSSNVRRASKRATQPAVLTASPNTVQHVDTECLCPICFEMISEAYMTKCGHSFCHACIKQSLEKFQQCPKCNSPIDRNTDLFPNFLLNEIVDRQARRQKEVKRAKLEVETPLSSTAASLVATQDQLDLPHVNMLLTVLANRKLKLEQNSELSDNTMLKEFLQQVLQKKRKEMDELQGQLCMIEQDLATVDQTLLDFSKASPTTLGINDKSIDFSVVPTHEVKGQEGFNCSGTSGLNCSQTSMANRRRKVDQHFTELESCYFSTRQSPLSDTPESTSCSRDGLGEFRQGLASFTRFSSLRNLAVLNYAADLYNTSSIVSSIEFDRDCDFFAIAGVTKKIKIFEYDAVIRSPVDVHQPVCEMLCNSKISSVTYSGYSKGLLASSDYEGTVTLWDSNTATKTRLLQEHEKRCWSVDFNAMDPNLLASGSDDSKVKLWYTTQENSIMSLETKANVCCVKFNPNSQFHLAFGSADHCVHYYDLRNHKQPLKVFKGHRKAVSYTKFLSSEVLVSASTDSQLRLWNVEETNCTRTFQGHTNEKNFVGLATNGTYIACGSENNSLYCYYKGLSKQLLTYKFDTIRSVLEKEKEEESTEFVSAVCWKPGSNVIVAANSQGLIKVLELV